MGVGLFGVLLPQARCTKSVQVGGGEAAGSPPLCSLVSRKGKLVVSTHTKPHLHTAFGSDAFGRMAERIARFFGTPKYIIGQTIAVIAWVAINASAIAFRWDPYPFIALNLAF